MADLTASGATPAVKWDVDATSNDWRMIASSTTISVERYQSSTWTQFFEWSYTGSVKIRAGSPSLVLEDTDSGDSDFRLVADADVLYLQVDDGSGFSAILQWNSALMTSALNVSILKETPILTFQDPTGGYGDYRFRSQLGKFYLDVDQSSSGSFTEILGTDGSLIYAANGIVAGHDVATGPSHAFRVKKFFGTIGGTGNIVQSLGTTDVLDKTFGVIFMMSNNTSSPYTYQLYDWRYAASNGFYVEVINNSSSGTGDSVSVTFDTSRYTNSGAPWRMIAFYAQP